MAKSPVGSLRSREYDTFLKLLRQRREASGISQEELSQRLGKAKTYLGKIELGTRRFDIIELLNVCHELNIDPARFVADLTLEIKKGKAGSSGI